jgi:hypothetical protein
MMQKINIENETFLEIEDQEIIKIHYIIYPLKNINNSTY